MLTEQGDDWLMVLSYFIIPYGVCDHICAWHSWFIQLHGEGVYCASTMHGTPGHFLVLSLCMKPKSWLFYTVCQNRGFH